MNAELRWLVEAGTALDERRAKLITDIMKQANDERDRLIVEVQQAVKDRGVAQEQALKDGRACTALIARCNELYAKLCKAKKYAPQGDPEVCRILLDASKEGAAT